jgi:ankyrin repeat protein
MAGFRRNLEVVQMLLDKGARPIGYSDEETGFLVYLCTAWESGPSKQESSRLQSQPFDPSILQLLVQHGLLISSSEIVAYALFMGCNVGVFGLLIDLGLDPGARGSDGHSALSYVLGRRGNDWEDSVAFVQKCLKHGVNINLRDENGCTPLYAAARNAHPAVIRAVLAAGAEVHVFNTYGQTPMQCAAMRDDVDVDILRPFLEFGRDMARSAAGNLKSMLMRMVKRKNLECIRLLLSSGLEMTPDMSPSILVLAAAIVGDAETVQQLLQHHEDIDFMIDDGWGNTALMIATRWGYDDVIRTLMSHMDKVNVASSSSHVQ